MALVPIKKVDRAIRTIEGRGGATDREAMQAAINLPDREASRETIVNIAQRVLAAKRKDPAS